MKEKIIGIGKIVDDEGTVELADVGIERSMIDEIQKAIDDGNIEISKEQFTIDIITKLIENHS